MKNLLYFNDAAIIEMYTAYSIQMDYRDHRTDYEWFAIDKYIADTPHGAQIRTRWSEYTVGEFITKLQDEYFRFIVAASCIHFAIHELEADPSIFSNDIKSSPFDLPF
jgi:hypothetical protein